MERETGNRPRLAGGTLQTQELVPGSGRAWSITPYRRGTEAAQGNGFSAEIDGLLTGFCGVESGASQQPCRNGKGSSPGFGTSSSHDAKLH
jgi:hypothetical protein